MTNMVQTPDRESARSPQPIRSALVLIFRVLLLGVGGLTAGLLGIVLAQFHPAPAKPLTEPPLLEQILRRSDALLKTVRHSSNARSARSPTADAANLPLPAASPLPIAAPRLTPPQRQQLQTELTTLKSQMTTLGNRTAQLEAKLGADRASPAPLETRLQSLEQQLQPSTSSPTPAPITPPQTATDTLKVTLPSDTLFAADQTSLLPNSEALLGTVINELQRYPGATIRVAAHTDAQTGAAPARARSLAQAEAIEQYLAQALGNHYHWMAIGYGKSHPLAANDTAVNRQRNRRVEIGIDPQ